MSRNKGSPRKFESAHATSLTQDVGLSQDLAGRHTVSFAKGAGDGEARIVNSRNIRQRERKRSSQKSAKQKRRWEGLSGTTHEKVVVTSRNVSIDSYGMGSLISHGG